MGGSIHEGGSGVSDILLAFSFGSLFGACVMTLAHLWITKQRDIEQRNEVIAACANARLLSYAAGYNDGKLDIQRGARS